MHSVYFIDDQIKWNLRRRFQDALLTLPNIPFIWSLSILDVIWHRDGYKVQGNTGSLSKTKRYWLSVVSLEADIQTPWCFNFWFNFLIMHIVASLCLRQEREKKWQAKPLGGLHLLTRFFILSLFLISQILRPPRIIKEMWLGYYLSRIKYSDSYKIKSKRFVKSKMISCSPHSHNQVLIYLGYINMQLDALFFPISCTLINASMTYYYVEHIYFMSMYLDHKMKQIEKYIFFF